MKSTDSGPIFNDPVDASHMANQPKAIATAIPLLDARKQPFPDVTDAEVADFVRALNATPRDEHRERPDAEAWARYFGDGYSEKFREATARFKRMKPNLESEERKRRLELATTASAICAVTGRDDHGWNSRSMVISLLQGGYSEDRLVEYVQFVHHAVGSQPQEVADRIMAPAFLFSARVFGALVPMLRVSAQRRAEIAPAVADMAVKILEARKPQEKPKGMGGEGWYGDGRDRQNG